MLDEQDDLILSCSCSALDHVVRFGRMVDDEGHSDTYVHVSLAHERSFWRRLKTALRYLFGDTCRYVCSTEVIVEPRDLPKLRAWLEHAEAATK